MDFITGLPSSQGYSVIMVVVDRLSKYGHFAPLKADYTSLSVAETFIKVVVKLHGFPKSIVSDRDKVFTSKFWRHLFRLSGTTLAMSSAYHPQSDGQSEALNKCLELYLRCFRFENPKAWFHLLPWAEFWYNSSFHKSIGMTPFKAVYGRDPPTLVHYQINFADPPELQSMLQQRDSVLLQLKSNLAKAQEFMKKYADKKRRPVEFQIGDLVLVKLQPYRQHSLVLCKNQTLGLRYFGPFPVLERIGAVAYKLLLPPAAKIHPVFHVSLLKPCKGDHSSQYLPLPLMSSEQGPVPLPQTVLQSRTILRNDQPVKQVLVHWEGMPESAATWEDWLPLARDYPFLNLEDKVIVNGGSVVRDTGDQHGIAKLAHESVRKEGHVAGDPPIQDARRSNRARMANRKYEDYVL